MVLIMQLKLALNVLSNRVVLCAMKKQLRHADEAGIAMVFTGMRHFPSLIDFKNSSCDVLVASQGEFSILSGCISKIKRK